MKTWRLPRLSRGGRTVRNIVFTLAILIWLWGWADFPIADPRLNFRRVEQENLMGPSEIQGVFQSADRKRVVGVLEDQVIWTGGQALSYDSWPRNGEGPTLVPMIAQYFGPENEFEVVAVDVPQGTRSARLDIVLDCWYYQDRKGGAWGSTGAPQSGALPSTEGSVPWQRLERDYHAEGELLRDGGVLFRIPLEDELAAASSMEQRLFQTLTKQNTYRQPDTVRGVNCHMEAVFCDEDGAELERAALCTPEGGSADGL